MTLEGHVKISIIMPVYNREDVVLSSINSILTQTYRHFEFLIVDDASTDKTKNIIGSLRDERIIYIPLRENVGAAAARNIGINKSTSKWIAFHDSDDFWEPNKLEKQVQRIKEDTPSIVFTSFIRVKDGKQEYIPSSINDRGDNIHKNILFGNFIATPTVLIHKDCLDKYGYFCEEMPRFQDWELWIRLSYSCSFTWIDEPLVKAYYTSESISADTNKLLKAYEMIWGYHKNYFIEAGPTYVARYLYSYGHNLMLYSNERKARKVLRESINAKLFSPVQLVSYILSFFGRGLYRSFYKIFKET